MGTGHGWWETKEFGSCAALSHSCKLDALTSLKLVNLGLPLCPSQDRQHRAHVCLPPGRQRVDGTSKIWRVGEGHGAAQQLLSATRCNRVASVLGLLKSKVPLKLRPMRVSDDASKHRKPETPEQDLPTCPMFHGFRF